jgi:hypothetical protein
VAIFQPQCRQPNTPDRSTRRRRTSRLLEEYVGLEEIKLVLRDPSLSSRLQFEHKTRTMPE